jgi:hypothetical protein
MWAFVFDDQFTISGSDEAASTAEKASAARRTW